MLCIRSKLVTPPPPPPPLYALGAAGILHRRYRYTDDLLRLEAIARGGREAPQSLPMVSGFLPLDTWALFLASHPDRSYVAFLVRGMQYGFRVGFDASSPLWPAPTNMQSAFAQGQVVDQMMAAEVAAGRLIAVPSPAGVHTNPIGLIQKPHKPNKFRLIVDLSAPQGASVNDGIDPSLCSLMYATVDQAAKLARQAGRGALMAKLDLSSGYRRVPVHAADQHLLGIERRGVVYCDKALPFGLRSAPKLFTAVADGLAWAMACRGIQDFLHYLDDFFFCSSPASTAAEEALRIAVPLCRLLSLPVAPDKVEGPSTSIIFLGILIDSLKQELRLPEAKLVQLLNSLRLWSRRRSATKRELQSLIGQLNHAAAVVRPGRSFMCHLIDTMAIPRRQHHWVRLNLQCKADIAWWLSFVRGWNGVALFPNLQIGVAVVADASGLWGCGAYTCGSLEWFQLPWPLSWENTSIAAKELLPLVIAAAIWGRSWHGTLVRFWSDNQAILAVLSSRTARNP